MNMKCVFCDDRPAPENNPCSICGKSAVKSEVDDCVDALAQDIRRMDGENNLGAGALAEALIAAGWRHSGETT